ncbi:hypothetical protein CRU96_12740 [Malaciobacter halophilus]|nr:replication initiation protein [Malaciobacter halophilus]RYA22485.1 hypothetical protein CRU96_12740 [Malaciobacter halophilus]
MSNIIRKHNHLITMRRDLSTNQQKLILLRLTKVPKLKVRYHASEKQKQELYNKNPMPEIWIDMDEIDFTLKHENTRFLEDFGDKLLDLRTKIQGINKKDFEKISWFSKFEYNSRDDRFRVRFTEDFKPYVYGWLERYTEYDIKYRLRFKSEYAIRIYELLKMNRFKASYSKGGSFKIDINELRDMLQTPTSYKKFSLFKSKVLDIRMRDINKHSDISVKYEPVKEGRSYKYLIFKFRDNNEKKESGLNAREHIEKNFQTFLDNLDDCDLNIQVEQFLKYFEHKYYTHKIEINDKYFTLNSVEINRLKNSSKPVNVTSNIDDFGVNTYEERHLQQIPNTINLNKDFEFKLHLIDIYTDESISYTFNTTFREKEIDTLFDLYDFLERKVIKSCDSNVRYVDDELPEF